jgi:cytidyltransferase-like protein
MVASLGEAEPLKQARPDGVYWGRFNPPHKGHLAMIRKLRRECRLTVAIGSSEHKNERANPFSGAERKAMLRAYLKESGMPDVRVMELKDGKSMSWAVDNLIRKCKPDLLFLSDERTPLAAIAAAKVRVARFSRTGRVSSTLIRESIASGRATWKNLTGKSVVRIIIKLDGIRRIKNSYGLA